MEQEVNDYCCPNCGCDFLHKEYDENYTRIIRVYCDFCGFTMVDFDQVESELKEATEKHEKLQDCLKPCPFCGDKPELMNTYDKGDPYRQIYVYCSRCGFQGNQEQTEEEAVKRWNTRYLTPTQRYSEKLFSLLQTVSAYPDKMLMTFVPQENWKEINSIFNFHATIDKLIEKIHYMEGNHGSTSSQNF